MSDPTPHDLAADGLPETEALVGRDAGDRVELAGLGPEAELPGRDVVVKDRQQHRPHGGPDKIRQKAHHAAAPFPNCTR